MTSTVERTVTTVNGPMTIKTTLTETQDGYVFKQAMIFVRDEPGVLIKSLVDLDDLWATIREAREQTTKAAGVPALP